MSHIVQWPRITIVAVENGMENKRWTRSPRTIYSHWSTTPSVIWYRWREYFRWVTRISSHLFFTRWLYAWLPRKELSTRCGGTFEGSVSVKTHHLWWASCGFLCCVPRTVRSFLAGVRERMEKFEYGFFDKRDAPPSISAKHFKNNRLAGSVAQKLVLFRLFPLIFSDIAALIPSIRVSKVLREILELVLAHPFRKRWLPHLHDLCIDFQHSFVEQFPAQMSPKIHFVAEYAQIIEDYGPSIRYWCIRYEGRHSYFKRAKRIPAQPTTAIPFVDQLWSDRHRGRSIRMFHPLEWSHRIPSIERLR